MTIISHFNVLYKCILTAESKLGDIVAAFLSIVSQLFAHFEGAKVAAVVVIATCTGYTKMSDTDMPHVASFYSPDGLS